MATKRVFIGIDLSSQLTQQLAHSIKRLRITADKKAWNVKMICFLS